MSNRYPTPARSGATAVPDFRWPTPTKPYDPTRRRWPRTGRPVPWKPSYPPITKEYPPRWPPPGSKPLYKPTSPVRWPGVSGFALTRILRFMPWLGWALLAWDLYQLYRLYKTMNYTTYFSCGGLPGPPWTAGPVYDYGFSPSSMCDFQAAHAQPSFWSVGTPWLKEWMYNPGGSGSWKGVQAWLLPAPPPGPAGAPGTIPGWVNLPTPGITLPPWVMPWPMLPGQPTPPPFPPPIRPRSPWPRPRRDPDNDPQVSPSPTPEVTSDPAPKTDPWPDGWPDTGPRPEPKTDPTPSPKTDPAPKGTKEKKVRLSHAVARRILGQLISGYSEVGDLVDALYEGLPKKYQTKDANLYQKIQDLYTHSEHWDAVEGLHQFYKNQQEDRIIGPFMAEAGDLLDDYGVELPFLRDGFAVF